MENVRREKTGQGSSRLTTCSSNRLMPIVVLAILRRLVTSMTLPFSLKPTRWTWMRLVSFFRPVCKVALTRVVRLVGRLLFLQFWTLVARVLGGSDRHHPPLQCHGLGSLEDRRHLPAGLRERENLFGTWGGAGLRGPGLSGMEGSWSKRARKVRHRQWNRSESHQVGKLQVSAPLPGPWPV